MFVCLYKKKIKGKWNRGMYWKHAYVGREDYRKRPNPYYATHHAKANTNANGNDDNNEFVALRKSTLAIVLIKDPLTWLQSICNSKYGLQINHNCRHIGDSSLRAMDRLVMDPNEKWDVNDIEYQSLVNYWNDWYNAYYTDSANGDFPIYFVRFEDMLYDTVSVVSDICQCVGGKMKHSADQFEYIRGTAKAHGKSKTRMRAQVIYANPQQRYRKYHYQDLLYINATVNHTLVKAFGYDLNLPNKKELKEMRKRKKSMFFSWLS